MNELEHGVHPIRATSCLTSDALSGDLDGFALFVHVWLVLLGGKLKVFTKNVNEIYR